MKKLASSPQYCLALICLSLAMSWQTCFAQEQQLRLASLEWLPYVGPKLPEQGLSAFIAASAAQNFGKQVKIDYFPWKRAMQLGGNAADYAGYFPAYYTKERAENCHFSQAMGVSTIGLAYLKSQPVQFESVEDLALHSPLAIGIVLGYSNGEKFDALARQGRLNLESSASDSVNLRKLMIGRLRAAVIDEAVLRYMLKTDPILRIHANQIAFHPRPLAELKLYVCFQRNAKGLENKLAFDRALQEMNLLKLADEYFQKLEVPSIADEPKRE